MPSLTRRDLLRSGLAVSASTLVIGPAARAHALLSGDLQIATEASPAVAPRERLLFDFGWKFFQGHGSDPRRDLGFGMGQGDFAKSGDVAFATAKCDDSKWRSLDLPHDWAVELPFVWDEEQNSHGYKPLGRRYPETSVGWYRRTFDIPAEDSGRRISVEFDGAFRSALVFLNGYFIGRNDNGYAPFCFDLTDFLNYGGKNYLMVRMDASFGDGWFYEGAGIYRHGFSSRVRWQILDAAGKSVATADSAQQSVAPGGSATFTANANLPTPALWSPETPNLYTAI